MIRRADHTDAERLYEMTLQFINSTPYGEVITPVRERVEECVTATLEHGVVFVAEVNGRVVGMLAGLVMPLLGTDSKYADEVIWWVDPVMRHGSLGPRLHTAFEQWASNEGAVVVKMVAPTTQPGVGRFLSHRGYRALEEAYWKVL